ncbi:MAG TPA: 8-amino-7-oxononanoate synthase [archaeon]|nr:8-amino-7-oxononanoate synthase [archaeon]
MDERWAFIDRYLKKQSQSGLLRTLKPLSAVDNGSRVQIGRKWLLNLASNDYLGLRNDPRLRAAAAKAADRWGVGSGASRLISGTTDLHERVEHELARFHSTESALTFSSGYAAGVGVISALVGRGDRIYLDRLCHACLYDGARASGAQLNRYQHNDPDHLEDLLKKDSSRRGRALVVTDTVFSMDGDRAPVADIAALCRKYSALFLADEAHAVGVLGPAGRGLAAEGGLDEKDVLVMGTLGKAFGVSGAYIAGPGKIRDYLINACRSFIYTTAPSPPLLAAIQASLGIISQSDRLRARLLQMAGRFRKTLQNLGIETLKSTTQIVPAVMGDVERALVFAENLIRQGVFAPAVRPPTVPEGTSRVRFSLTAALTDDYFEFLLSAVARALKKM